MVNMVCTQDEYDGYAGVSLYLRFAKGNERRVSFPSFLYQGLDFGGICKTIRHVTCQWSTLHPFLVPQDKPLMMDEIIANLRYPLSSQPSGSLICGWCFWDCAGQSAQSQARRLETLPRHRRGCPFLQNAFMNENDPGNPAFGLSFAWRSVKWGNHPTKQKKTKYWSKPSSNI